MVTTRNAHDNTQQLMISKDVQSRTKSNQALSKTNSTRMCTTTKSSYYNILKYEPHSGSYHEHGVTEIAIDVDVCIKNQVKGVVDVVDPLNY